MESIIILTDFTSESRNAAVYGYALAMEKKLPVVLVHVYDAPLIYMPDDFSGAMLPAENAQGLAFENLQKITAEYQSQYPQVVTTSRLALLEPEAVLDEEKSHAGSLIVLGVNAENVNDWWEDNSNLDVLREAHHNVLAVPQDCAFHPVKNIVLALRPDQKGESFPAAQLGDLLRLTGATLQVVTVDADVPLAATLQEVLSPFQPTYHNIRNGEKVDDALLHFVPESGADWMAVVPGEYGFWSGLFHKSHTLALAGQSRIPLLALHKPEA